MYTPEELLNEEEKESVIEEKPQSAQRTQASRASLSISTEKSYK